MKLPDESDRDAIAKFAASFNAYEHYGDFATASIVAKKRNRGSIEEIRAELFMSFRGSNHRGDDKFLETYIEVKPLLTALLKDN